MDAFGLELAGRLAAAAEVAPEDAEVARGFALRRLLERLRVAGLERQVQGRRSGAAAEAPLDVDDCDGERGGCGEWYGDGEDALQGVLLWVSGDGA